ncbi:hypothetical protein AB0D49_09810 [Streptomyces sp. NPDC048290]|uniref:hypothetical protein n=1 Tax=Streptomyces sp. NPDC048290 TaxID=3155811 RepID=UPI0034275BB1
MSAGVPLAGGKSEIFEAALWFLPDWAQNGVLVLIVLLVLVSWGLKIRHRIALRRARRAASAAPVVTQHGDGGSGADFLGPYAPQTSTEPRGADYLGPYAPQPPTGPQGADFLGSYAPPGHRRDGVG